MFQDSRISRLAIIRGLLSCLILLLFLPISARSQKTGGEIPPELLHRLNQELTVIISYDKFVPPIASRIYAYANAAAYEAYARHHRAEFPTLAGQLNQLTPVIVTTKVDSNYIAYEVTQAFIETAGGLIFNQERFKNAAWKSVRDLLPTPQRERPDSPEDRMKMKQELANNSSNSDPRMAAMEAGSEIAKHLIAWAVIDGYPQRTALPRYHPQKVDPSKWVSTPPSYLDGLEPHWNKQRPFVMKSPDEIPCPPHIPFSSDSGSAFWKQAYEVYDVTQRNDSLQIDLAWFWDDNCKATEFSGHFMEKSFKQTPIGHWIYITQKVCEIKKLPFEEVLRIYTHISVAMADGMIAAWTEKYRSELVRPVTYIHRNIDDSWMPILETPYFPEHPSAHAVISAATAQILGSYVGDSVSFTDASPQAYGRQPLKYFSLERAAYDAALSRMYGGIHYRTGCVAGNELGKSIGGIVIERLQLKPKTLPKR